MCYLLLELLIALGLVAFAMTFLFSFVIQNLKVQKKIESIRKELLVRQNFQIRLQDIFTSLSFACNQPRFYTKRFPKEKQESLVFLFDQGVDPDPLFSGTVLGRIYLDNRDLVLTTWPIKTEGVPPWRREVLLPNISSFSCRFLGETPDADSTIQHITPTIGWMKRWDLESKTIPSILRIDIQKDEESVEFAFRFPTSYPIVTYQGER